MKIGILGSDNRAAAIGRLFASTGHDVTISDPLDSQRAQRVASEIGAGVEMPYRQAITRELLLVATPRQQLDRALTALGTTPEAIVVDVMEGDSDGPRSGPEMLARKLDSHTVVRALVVLPQPGATVLLCGDDDIAKKTVDEAFTASGCSTADRGTLANAPELDPPKRQVAA